MFGQARRSVVVVAVASVLAASSFAFGSLTSKSSLADTSIDRTVEVVAQQDGVVTSSKPRQNKASDAGLVAQKQAGVRKVSYLRFTVTKKALRSGKLVGAKVLLTPRQSVTAAVQLRVVRNNDWSERDLTYRSAPAVGAVIDTVGTGPVGTRWIDVSSIVKRAGTYSFALTASRGTATFSSSETSKAPSLLLRLKDKGTAGGPKPSPTQSQPGKPDPTPKPTTDPRGCKKRFPGDPCAGTMYYGASIEGGNINKLEAQVGRRVSVHRIYMTPRQKAASFAAHAAEATRAGRLPLMSTKVPGSWASVAAGKQDGWLIDRVKALANVNGPVWLALHHEPRGDGSASDWVNMQQHARKIIDKYSSNIALVGILNGWDFLQRGGHPEAFRMPVGTGVDIMGFDSYNPWAAGNGQKWKSVPETMSPGLTIQRWGYPTLVAETGLHVDGSNPGRAATWLRDQYNYGLAHDFLAISYFHSAKGSWDGSWALSGERLTAFGQNLARGTTARIS